MPSTERILFVFDDRWRLSSDRLQWIVERRQGQGWRPMHFVAGKKTSLKRILREEGVNLTQEAHAFLGALPATFREFQMRTPRADGHSMAA